MTSTFHSQRHAPSPASLFQFELMRIEDVLVTAAAAAPEIWARWRGALRGRLDDVIELGLGELFLLPRDPGHDAFPVNRERHEDRLAIRAPDFFPAKGDIFNR